MKKLKKIQLHMGEEYWKKISCIPERHSLLWFLVNHEFREIPELHMKRHILISMELASYSKILPIEDSLDRQMIIDILWNSWERANKVLGNW